MMTEAAKKQTALQKTLETFFVEKQLDERIYPVEHGNMIHAVDSSFVIILIINYTSEEERKQIWSVISKIDFNNGDVHHFLKHLAYGYVKTTFDLEGKRIDGTETTGQTLCGTGCRN